LLLAASLIFARLIDIADIASASQRHTCRYFFAITPALRRYLPRHQTLFADEGELMPSALLALYFRRYAAYAA